MNAVTKGEMPVIDPEKLMPGLWSFPIVLPDNPLKWLNCYVIKPEDGSRALLIDTGFNRPECYTALEEGMAQLSLDPCSTDVFITHCHADHAGCAGRLAELGCRVLMGKVDHDLENTLRIDRLGFRNRALEEGMPLEIYELTLLNNHGKRYPSKPFEAEELVGGEELCYGDFHLRCIATPGHTPGHLCLYEPEKQIMFLGDHVLFDITPNITNWPGFPDSLGRYIENLRLVSQLPVSLALPAHRNRSGKTMQQRIDELISHHEKRLDEAEAIVRECPGITVYQLAGRMKWKIRAADWDSFPPGQKWFAFGEAMAHVDHLVVLGRVLRRVENGMARYYLP